VEHVIEMDEGVRLADLADELAQAGVVVKQRLGARLLVVDAPSTLERPPRGLRLLAADEVARRASGTSRDGERLALAARLRRTSPERLRRKQSRPHTGAEWDSPTGGARPDPADGDLPAGTPGGVTLTPETAAGTATHLGAVTTTGRAAPPETAMARSAGIQAATATPTKPERLINEVVVGLVFVDAPERSGYGMDLDEMVDAIAEVQDGTEWLAAQQPTANITWSYDVRIVTVDVEPWTGANWPGLPDEWYGGSDGTGTAGIDAALMRSSNGKIYLFRGSEYVRYSAVANGVDSGYPKPIAGNWHGLPASFTSGIDAAFMRESNQKIYFFKGSEYVRIDTTSSTMDAGYPQPIAGNWPGLPASFTSGIDAALQRKDNDKIYFFKGDQYVRFTTVAGGVDPGYPTSLDPNWGGMPDDFQEGIDAALWRDSNGAVYLFKGGKYVRFSDVPEGVDDGYPAPLGLSRGEAELLWRDPAMAALGHASGAAGLDAFVANLESSYGADAAYAAFFTRWPVGWFGYAGYPRLVMHLDNDGWGPLNLDSVFAHETGHIFGAPDEYSSSNCECASTAGRFYTLANGNCANCDGATVACIMKSNSLAVCSFTPKHLGWGPFQTSVDAALWRGSNDSVYLFSGDEYIRYTDVGDGRDAGYPRRIKGAWIGIPTSFQSNIDAALWRESNGKIYLFKGSQYVRLEGSNATMDAGYPQPIAGNWNGLPASFTSGIDAAFWRESNNKIYFFKGNQYARLDTATATMDAGYPKPIAGNWPGLPASFTGGIDAALMRRDNHKIYFFRGTQYARLDGETSTMDAGYPNWIDKNWMPFPR
jgi:hypothetical protein